MICCAVMGHGVVGSGVAEVLCKNAQSIAKKAGGELYVKYILDIRDFKDHALSDRFTKKFEDILEDPEVLIVAETMGGLNPAYEYTKKLLEAGKSVVTSNKELVATKGAELLRLAEMKNVNYLFEASVGGGIPIIRPLHQCLGANEIEEVTGILNGTTNYVLTKMIKEGMSFETALALAQENGFAEKDPTADVEGIDAGRKISILASLAFGKHIYPDEVKTEGITKITLRDVEYASADSRVIKLLGRCKKLENGKVLALVAPCLIPKSHPLAMVDDVFNGVLVRGDAVGDVMFYGKGAGKLPTASAVVADMMDCAVHQDRRRDLSWTDAGRGLVADYREEPAAYYIRASAEDAKKAIAGAGEIFGGVREIAGSRENEIAFVTKTAPEKTLLSKLSEYQKLPGVKVESVFRSLEE